MWQSMQDFDVRQDILTTVCLKSAEMFSRNQLPEMKLHREVLSQVFHNKPNNIQVKCSIHNILSTKKANMFMIDNARDYRSPYLLI